MPCYLFTYHAYGSWMPDRSRGFVRRGEGVLPTDKKLAAQYKKNAKQTEVSFNQIIQRHLVDAVREACEHQQIRLHIITADVSHVHALVSWKSERGWQIVRSGIKSSMTRRLNLECGRRTWFAKAASRKRVVDREHFDYLMTKYLPKHSGAMWRE